LHPTFFDFEVKTECDLLHRYGGIFEQGSREYTLDDFYALQLDKMDKYICLKKSDVVIPTEGEEESSSDEDDGDDDEGEEEDDDDGEGTGEDSPDVAKQEPVAAEEEVEAGEEDVSNSFRVHKPEIHSRNRICVLKPHSSWVYRKIPLDLQKT